MNIGVRVDGLMVVTAVVVVAAVAVYWNRKEIGQAVEGAANTVNPFSRDNIANRSVNAWGEYVTGEQGWTLGGQVYDWLHPEAVN